MSERVYRTKREEDDEKKNGHWNDDKATYIGANNTTNSNCFTLFHSLVLIFLLFSHTFNPIRGAPRSFSLSLSFTHSSFSLIHPNVLYLSHSLALTALSLCVSLSHTRWFAHSYSVPVCLVCRFSAVLCLQVTKQHKWIPVSSRCFYVVHFTCLFAIRSFALYIFLLTHLFPSRVLRTSLAITFAPKRNVRAFYTVLNNQHNDPFPKRIMPRVII